MAITFYTKVLNDSNSLDDQFKLIGRYCNKYECSLFAQNATVVNAWYVKQDSEYYKLPGCAEDIGALPICGKCPNQLLCIDAMAKSGSSTEKFEAYLLMSK
jgi:hypothetical protein